MELAIYIPACVVVVLHELGLDMDVRLPTLYVARGKLVRLAVIGVGFLGAFGVAERKEVATKVEELDVLSERHPTWPGRR